MDQIKLLFVEDDATFSYIVKNSFELTGKYEVQTASDGKEGLEMYSAFSPDVIVADIEMPVLDGMDMVKKIRNENELIPILFASGRTDVQNVLKGYDLNIDNFIKKPYIPEELDAHIRAILRRIDHSSTNYEPDNVIRIGKYIFNVDKQTLQYKEMKRKIYPRQAQILERLCKRRGKLVMREQLLEELWKANNFFVSRSLDVFVSKLRKYLSDDPAIKIETIKGKGLLLSIT